MKKIGIIAAMNEEMQEIKKIMDNLTEKVIFDLFFYCCCNWFNNNW